MTTIKAFTNLSQSKTLSKILPVESADMHYNNASIKGINYVDEHRAELMEYNRAIKVLSKYTINPLFEVIPCWDLTALINVYPMVIGRDSNMYYCWQGNELLSSRHYDNPIDACYEMILKLHEFGLL